MARDFVVIGGGVQGRAVASDLLTRRTTGEVTVVDTRPLPAAGNRTRFARAQLDAAREPGRLAAVLAGADACVVALPGSTADAVLPLVAAQGVPTVDISFTPEAYSKKIDRAARRAGAPIIRDVGVAPGLSHILAAFAAAELGGLSDLKIYVGGLPQRPTTAAFRHAVYFNAQDLISEYVRPARMRRGGRNLAVDPLAPSETERLVDPDVGELEAFPSDGLRTLLQSFPGCPEMAELTLRYPGHLAFMRRRAAAGAFDGGVPGRSPLEASAAELAEKFSGEKFPDVLIMEVRAAHQGRSVNWRLVDRRRGGQSAMARTTAFTAAAAACALASGGFDGVGCLPPEALGRTEGIGKKVLSDLKARDIELVRGAKLAAATPRPHGRA